MEDQTIHELKQHKMTAKPCGIYNICSVLKRDSFIFWKVCMQKPDLSKGSIMGQYSQTTSYIDNAGKFACFLNVW